MLKIQGELLSRIQISSANLKKFGYLQNRPQMMLSRISQYVVYVFARANQAPIIQFTQDSLLNFECDSKNFSITRYQEMTRIHDNIFLLNRHTFAFKMKSIRSQEKGI